ncbi:TPA: hypothetical protein N0F65_002629 [Lagenidium giganteum]|uniref:Protein kinase domain-containing protein n=1 Tax=Lagenidium giganteum TaxID=4803 RepID=A0AAV2Z6K6_9STRA|nr:TPA: hypothetical protein N0F65_002629 [Lagenidium giganteum]
MENYNIYDEIGRGTHSFVYKARRKRSIEYVAVKSTAKCRMDKILNEVQLLHKLDSPHVLRFFNWYESQNHIWLIFEFCIGGDLLNLITQDKQLPEAAVKGFGHELIAGLQYLHMNGILFCDLKPANILIDEYGSLKLADFGLARRIPSRDDQTTKPLAPGSPNYMAPELFQQAPIHSFASDFWALVSIQPFTNKNFSELARIIQTEELLLPLPGYSMSPAFCDLLRRLLEKDPHRRITWDQLVNHPFWDGFERLPLVQMPRQELFDAQKTNSHELSGSNLVEDLKEDPALSVKASDDNRDDDTQNPSHSSEKLSSCDTKSNCGSDNDANDGVTDNEEDDDEDSDDLEGDEVHNLAVSDGLIKSDARIPFQHAVSQTQATTDYEIASIPADKHPYIRPTSAPMASCSGMTQRADEGSHDTTPETTSKTKPSERRIPNTAPAAPMKRNEIQRERGISGSAWPNKSTLYPLRKPAKLIFTAADCDVKPIMGSDDIEAIPLPSVRSERIPFTTTTPDALLTCGTEKLESHLKEIYVGLKNADATLDDKRQLLVYLHSLSLHSKLANVIVNSSMIVLLVKMLCHTINDQSNASDSITAQLCMVLGVLFRYATFIPPSYPAQTQALVKALNYVVTHRDSSSTQGPNPASTENRTSTVVRCRALACLGELLFYISTQKDWDFPSGGLLGVLHSLDHDHLVMRHYAVRTVGNILIYSSDPEVLRTLVSERVVILLVRSLKRCVAADEQSSPGALPSQELRLQASVTQTLAHQLKHIRFPTAAEPLPAKTKTAVVLTMMKLPVLQWLWSGITNAAASTELAIASFNVLNALLDLPISTLSELSRMDLVECDKAKQAFVANVVAFPPLLNVLEPRSRYDDDSQSASRSGHHESIPKDRSQPSKSTDPKAKHHKRYADDSGGAPALVRAKAVLFVHLALQSNVMFASQCTRYHLWDLVDRLISPYAAFLRAAAAEGNVSKCLSSSKPGSCGGSSTFGTASLSSESTSVTSPLNKPVASDTYLLQCVLILVRGSIRTGLKLLADVIQSADTVNGNTASEADQNGSKSRNDASHDRSRNGRVSGDLGFSIFTSLLKSPHCKAQSLQYLLREQKEYSIFVRLMARIFALDVQGGHVRSMTTASATSGMYAEQVAAISVVLFHRSSNDAASLVVADYEAIYAQLLPAMTMLLQVPPHDEGTRTRDIEMRANCLRVMYNIMLHCHDHASVEDSMLGLRDEFIRVYFLPCLGFIFDRHDHPEENVWRFAIELLFGLVCRDISLLHELSARGLSPALLQLLSTPSELHFHSLPSSATKLVKLLVHDPQADMQQLLAWLLPQNLVAGLEFAEANRLIACLVDLLESVYHVLHLRYETLKRGASGANGSTTNGVGLEVLVQAGPTVMRLCAMTPSVSKEVKSDDPQNSPSVSPEPQDNEVQAELIELADLASRCLVFLSQIFGNRLNEELFQKRKDSKGTMMNNAVDRSMMSVLENLETSPTVILRTAVVCNT